MRSWIFGIAAGLLACGVLGLEALADPGSPEVSRGARLYSDNCGRCHNARSPRELDDRDWPIVITHMRLTGGIPGDQARAITAFLMASNNPPPEPTAETRKSLALSGAELIETYGCRGCHVIQGEGGQAGPSLDGVFERRDEDWVRAQIRDPRSHNPNTVMPDFGFTKDQVEAMVQVLRGGR